MRAMILAALACLPLGAQFWSELANPKVRVTIMHPPGLGLKVDRVAFGPGRDPWSRELADQISTSLVQSRALEVVDRSHLDAILTEQNLGQSGYVQPETIAKLGKLLGPTALVVVNVSRRAFARTPGSAVEKYRDGNTHQDATRTRFSARTSLDYAATVQVVDLSTARIFGAEQFVESPSEEASSYQGPPAFPPDAVVLQRALDAVQLKVTRMLVAWPETRDLVFFDDAVFGMDQAHALVKSKNYEAALDRARKGLSESQSTPGQKPKYYPRAYYNVGIIHFILGDYDAALPFLRKALDMQPDASIYQSAHKECEEAIRLRESLRTLADAKSAAAPETQTPAPAPVKVSEGVEVRLQRLQELYRKGLLSKGEYEAKRKEILKDL
ncbi:MAG TPA: CsgG/HfaB family protein [Holophagaceae bacterium]|nr:CsgG/HfaB family protein [Holophagaceae bacterium]